MLLSEGALGGWKGANERRASRFPRTQGGESAEAFFIVLYGLLDAEQHGGEPLVQTGNAVKFFHLEIKIHITTYREEHLNRLETDIASL